MNNFTYEYLRSLDRQFDPFYKSLQAAFEVKEPEGEFKSILKKRAESEAKISDATKVLLITDDEEFV